MALAACTSPRRPDVPPDDPATGPLAATASRLGPSGDTRRDQWVVGYYAGYQADRYPVDRIDWSTLTHLTLAGVLVRPDQALDTNFYQGPGRGEAMAKALSAAAHAHGRTALLMLGGAGNGPNIARAAATVPARKALVDQLTATADRLGYDGYDLDWEDGHPRRPDGSPDYGPLLALARALKIARPQMVLTFPGTTVNPNTQRSIDPVLAALAGTVDRFSVMSYFPATAIVGSGWASWFNSPLKGAAASTPISIEDSLRRYVDAGVPAHRLMMGIGFYTICYPDGVTGPRQPTGAGKGGAMGGGDNRYPAGDVFEAGGLWEQAGEGGRRYDGAVENPYLSFASPVSSPRCGAPTRYVPYEDERSIVAKGAFSKANGYGGTIVWTIQQGVLPAGAAGGLPRDHLLQALRRGFLS
jgi:chitinase